MPINKRASLYIPAGTRGVCVWEIEGKYLGDGDGNFLSIEGVVNDKKIEEKMRKAAYYWLEEPIGQPYWIAGARKVTSDELDDQKARFHDGYIPDPIDEARQIMERGK